MMEIDYQNITNSLADVINYCLPMAIYIGLIERVIRMVIKAATGRTGD